MPTQSLTSTDLQHFIDKHRIEATILPMDEHTLTVPDAAQALGVETDQIITVQTEKGKGVVEFCQVSGVFKIQINRWADFFYEFNGQGCFAALPWTQDGHRRIILQPLPDRPH